MSEKLFALLLRLYPARFRNDYGDEALHLFRARLRVENSFPARLRLCFDLLADLVFSLPREHKRAPAVSVRTHALTQGAVPTFFILEDHPPRAGSFIFGTGFALAALGIFIFLLSHGGSHHFPNTLLEGRSASGGSAALSGQTSTPAVSDSGPVIDAAERTRVIAGVIANLRLYYRHPDEVRQVSDLLTADEKNDAYSGITSVSIFTTVINRQMLEVTHDRDLMVMYCREPVSARGSGSSITARTHQQLSGVLHPIDEHFGIRIP